MTVLLNCIQIFLVILLVTFYTASALDPALENVDERAKSEGVTQPLKLPSFQDFKKEIENIFPSSQSQSPSSSDYVLEPGVTLDRDYDFYDDTDNENDVGASESAQVTLRSSFFPQSQR